MKLAFLHRENQFAGELLNALRQELSGHEILPWSSGKRAPADDIELLIAIGKVGPEQLEGLDKLVFIQTASAGYEGVDVDAASKRGIWVSFAPSEVTGNAAAVAEFAVLLLLAASRRLGALLKAEKDSSIHPEMIHPALTGKTVCIVGVGGIGEEVVKRLKPFGVNIVATDEHPETAPEGVTAYAPEKLREAVATADCVLLCVRASPANENLIDAAMLKTMKRGAILVNIARGTLIDENALLEAVKSGQIAAAGLDVVRDEPLQPENPLLSLPQVIVTPHVAGFTDTMLRGTADYLVKVIGEVAEGKKPGSVLNQPATPRLALKG